LGAKIWVVTTRRKEKTETLKQAQMRLGISRTTLWRLIRKYKIEVADDVLDGRSKRVKTSDVDRVLKDAMRIRKGRF
jgi:predicted DNA-binding protein (UPF0251 family)